MVREMMTRRLKLAMLFVITACVCVLMARGSAARDARAVALSSTRGDATAQQQTADSASQQKANNARTLTEQERRGKAIYLRGTSDAGRDITALVGELDVPGATLTCAGCHGTRGEGRTEGGVTAGNLTWSNLIKPYGHTHPTGRKHGAFTEASFARAVLHGIDPAGNEMLVAMPRYRMSSEDMADLVAYLKRIETDFDPGLTDERLIVGALLPSTGPLASTGAAMRDVLTAYFDDVNSRNGIYNRKIELRVGATGEGAEGASASARRLVEHEQVFALVGGMSAGFEGALAALAAEHEVPVIGPATLMPQVSAPLNRQVFYLMPGLAEMARALVNFASARPELKDARVAVIHAETELARGAANAAADQAERMKWGAVTRLSFRPGAFDSAAVAAQLKRDRVSAVFIFPAGGEDAALVKEAARVEWTPHIFLPGVLSSRDLVETVPETFENRFFLAFPTVPTDVTPEGLAEFRALLEKHKVEQRHTASQLAAFASAKVFVEGLKRAGRELTRERLLTALEGLYDYDSGVTPRLSFGPNRRVGASGSYVVVIDPRKKEYTVAGGWVSAH